jgi:nitroimidazol reductase NimA-like FMN-containing flavoprotein (pyridoxamine 5'-phosphate oxidase superfamily)
MLGVGQQLDVGADPADVTPTRRIPMAPPARAPQQPKQDTLDRLERDVDAWVATADPAAGTPYLVPLSFLWDGATLLVATPAASPTSRNLQSTGKVRLGIGPTRELMRDGHWVVP